MKLLLTLLALVFLVGCAQGTAQLITGAQEIIGTREQGEQLLRNICKDGPYQYGFIVGTRGEKGVTIEMDANATSIGESCAEFNPNWESDYRMGVNVGRYLTIAKDLATAYILEGIAFGKSIAAGSIGIPMP